MRPELGATVRSTLRALYERFAVTAGLPSVGRWWHRADAVILAYHNVLPDHVPAGGERSLHLRLASFIAQIDQLRATHEVVPLSQLLAPPGSGRPRAAVTFDDAYRGAVTVAVPALVARGVPATIFVAPGLLDDQVLWWDALSDPRTGMVDATVRAHALEAHHGSQPVVRAWAMEARLAWREAGPLERTATLDELVAAAGSELITIGSHTWSHVNLQAADRDTALEELRRSGSWLAESVPHFVPWVSYPYGLRAAATPALAADAGYVAGLDLSPGWVRAPVADPFRLPRDNVPAGRSPARFALRTAGFR